jgi:cobalt/nickel transport system permease protein
MTPRLAAFVARLRAPAFTVAILVALQAWLNGRAAATALALRIAAVTTATALLLATVPPRTLLAGLRRLGAPQLLVDVGLLAARYVGVLGETLRTAREAQRVRLGWQRLGVRIRSFGTLGGVVVARAIDQSAAIGDAMRARGGGRR